MRSSESSVKVYNSIAFNLRLCYTGASCHRLFQRTKMLFSLHDWNGKKKRRKTGRWSQVTTPTPLTEPKNVHLVTLEDICDCGRSVERAGAPLRQILASRHANDSRVNWAKWEWSEVALLSTRMCAKKRPFTGNKRPVSCSTFSPTVVAQDTQGTRASTS